MHTEIRIINEDGVDVGPNEVGELIIKGPNITPGYWNNPEATEKSFIDGWLKTGDAAKRDDEGFVYIVDRSKDMYISGGEMFTPPRLKMSSTNCRKSPKPLSLACRASAGGKPAKRCLC